MINELIPTIDREYRTLADRDHRAIAGLSMGGGQALNIGLHHLDLFSHVGGFSAALGRAACRDAKAGCRRELPARGDLQLRP